MTNEEIEELQKNLFEVEEELIDKLPNASFKSVITEFKMIVNEALDAEEIIQVLNDESTDERFKEAFYSSFRVLKAFLAEIEYRIRENKI